MMSRADSGRGTVLRSPASMIVNVSGVVIFNLSSVGKLGIEGLFFENIT